MTYLNPAAESLLGVALEDAQLNLLSKVIQFDRLNGDEDAPACFLSSSSARHSQTGSAELYTSYGQHLAISYSCAPLVDQDGQGAVYVLRDETEKKQLLDNLREMAFHDALTTLPNRRAVEGRLARALRTARDLGQQHAFCYIDLDQFKLVNDTCGHSVGDTLLMDIAQTMKAALPTHAYLGRLGGDEFGLILFDTRSDEAIRICRQLIQRIRDFRFEHKGRRFTLGACAGVAPITQAATTAGDLMIQADMACYRAKSEGSGRVMLYEADEVGFRRLETEMGWAADFAQALEANQFLPYRQLIRPTSRGGQPHYEVLIRWQRDGVVEGPAKLLPALERYGQAPILDRWMLEAVVSYLAAQPDDNAVYFINLSGKTVADESFLGVVCHMLDHYGVEGSRLGFEVTETAAVVNLEDAQRLISGLRERGCQFALDDFGRRTRLPVRAGRFRARRFLILLSQASARRLPQDRRCFRARHAGRPARPGHRPFDHPAGARFRHVFGGRAGGRRRHGGAARRDRCGLSAGLPHPPPGSAPLLAAGLQRADRHRQTGRVSAPSDADQIRPVNDHRIGRLTASASAESG